MLVRDYMTKHPMMVEPEMRVLDAQRAMGENDVRHLPVVKQGKRLAGLVSRGRLLIHPAKLESLNVWEISRYVSDLKLKDVMVPAQDVIVIDKMAPLEEAARIMVNNKVRCLPVVDEDGNIEGIITKADLLAQLMEMLGARRSGIRVTVRMPNADGEAARLMHAVGAKGWKIPAICGVPSPRKPDMWDAMIKVRDASRQELIAVIEGLENHEIVDLRET